MADWETDSAPLAQLPAAYDAVQKVLNFIIKKPPAHYYEFACIPNDHREITLPFAPFCGATTIGILALAPEFKPFASRQINDPLTEAEYDWIDDPATEQGGGNWGVGYRNRRLYIADKFRKGYQIRFRYCAGMYENSVLMRTPDLANIPPEIKEAVQLTAAEFAEYGVAGHWRGHRWRWQGIPLTAHRLIRHLIAK